MVGSINWRNTPIVESEQATLGDVECETAVSTPCSCVLGQGLPEDRRNQKETEFWHNIWCRLQIKEELQKREHVRSDQFKYKSRQQ